MNPLQTNLVIALPAEAKPLISHFGLKRQQPDGEFPIYSAGEISLILSGIGKDNAATATAYLFRHQKDASQALWLNIGIAGHSSRPIGQPILAQRIIDEETGREWAWDFDFTPPCETEDLLTLDQPEFDYRRPEALDMEAAGIIHALTQLGPKARLHCLKVISDNQDSPAHGINGRMVADLINDQLNTISILVQRLLHPHSFTTIRRHEAS